MAIKINGTTVVDNSRNVLASDGTVSVPSISFSSDTNTGIYRKGTDQLAITTAGTEAAYFDASGNTNIVGVLSVGGNTAWHAGNDGSGSLLDADKLDGVEGASYLRSDAVDTFAVSSTNCNASTTVLIVDADFSGTTTLTSNRTNRAMYIDMDHTSTGGTTTDGVRETVESLNVALDSTGTPYALTSVYGNVRSANTTGTISSIYAVRGYAQGDSGTGGTTTSVYGVMGDARDGGSGTIGTIYGIHGIALKETTATNTLATAVGGRLEVEIDANTITNAYAGQHIIDNDGGTITTGYLTYGAYEGTLPTTAWSAYYPSAAPSYFANEVRIGSTSDLGSYLLQVSGATKITGNIDSDGTVTAATFNATSTTNGGFQGIDADSATNPSFTWTADLDTGMYRTGTNGVGITTSGVNRLTIDTGNVTSTLPVRLPDGSITAPSLTFSSDTNTGIYRKGTDQLGITTAGTEAAYFDASGNTNIVGNLGVKSATPSGDVAINTSITLSENTNRYGINNYLYISNSTLTADRAHQAACNIAEYQGQGSVAFTSNVYGAFNEARTSTSGGYSIDGEGQLYGSYNRARHSTDNTTYKRMEYSYGSYNYCLCDGDTAIMDNAYGVYSLVRPTVAGSTINNGYLFYGTNSTVTGTFTNRYGVYIATGINNYFAGGIQIGGTAAGGTSAAGLGVNATPPGTGNITASGTITATTYVGITLDHLPSIPSSKFVNRTSLTIYDSAGAVVKTIYGTSS